MADTTTIAPVLSLRVNKEKPIPPNMLSLMRVIMALPEFERENIEAFAYQLHARARSNVKRVLFDVEGQC